MTFHPRNEGEKPHRRACGFTWVADREYDFSRPILDAGLQILVHGTGAASGANPLEGFLRLLLSPVLLVWLGIAAVLLTMREDGSYDQIYDKWLTSK